MRTLNLQTIMGRLWKDESGSNALEYGLIVGLISLAIAAGATAAGSSLGSMFNTIGTKIATEASGLST